MAEITMNFTGQMQDINEFLNMLFESETVNTGTQKEIPGGGTITLDRMTVRKALGIPQIIHIILSSVGGTIAVNMASNYLYDKWKGHKGGNIKMSINRREVHLDKGEITKVIEEEIRMESDDR
jgi:hypothetical protein